MNLSSRWFKFRRNQTDDQEIDSPMLLPTEPRLHVRSKIIFYSTLRISGGRGQFQNACGSQKRNWKPSEITFEKLKPPRSILETFLRSRKEEKFVGTLSLVQFSKNSFKMLYTVEGLLDLVEKASFSKEFWCEFHSGGVGISSVG